MKTKRLSREDRKQKALKRCYDWLSIVDDFSKKRRYSNVLRKSFKMLEKRFDITFKVYKIVDYDGTIVKKIHCVESVTVYTIDRGIIREKRSKLMYGDL